MLVTVPKQDRGAKPAVMADVARLAGVSNQTVSRVVNGAPSISPRTRSRVEDAIRRLGYRPNSAARALVRGRSGIVGVVSTGLAHFGPTRIQRTIEDAARAAGFFASSVSLPELSRALLEESIAHLRRQSVEGIIIVAGQDDAVEVARSQPSDLPVVVVEGDLSRAPWTVGVDQVLGARLATRHLLELGHREIAHIAGPPTWGEARARREGWRCELAAAGLRAWEPPSSDWSALGGHAAGRELLADTSITAVFCASDQIAIGAIRAAHELGRRVPDDLSVVGFDALPETGYLVPSLTTVRQDFDAVGRRSVELVQLAMAGGKPPVPQLIAPELLVRESTRRRESASSQTFTSGVESQRVGG